MRKLLGPEHRRILAALHELAEAGPDTGETVVLLEGEAGVGKTRVVRELYREMRKIRGPDAYWPQFEENAGTGKSRDPLPGRKAIGPDIQTSDWPKDALPGFGWWQLQCERSIEGDPMDVIGQFRPEIETHWPIVARSWSRRADFKDKFLKGREKLVDRAGELLEEGSLEEAAKLLAEAGLVVPVFALLTRWAIAGTKALQKNSEMRSLEKREVSLGRFVTKRRQQASEDVADMIAAVTHRKLPGVVAIEDIHLMPESLGDFLDRLHSRKTSPLVVATARTHEPDADTPYARWRHEAIRSGQAKVMNVPLLGREDRRSIVLEYAGNTPDEVIDKAIDLHKTPLALEAILGSPAVQREILEANGSIPSELLTRYPTGLEAVFRERFEELSPTVQTALAVAAGCLPDPRSDHTPQFIPAIVTLSAKACSRLKGKDHLVAAGLKEATTPDGWLLGDRAGVGVRFREALCAHAAADYLEKELLLLESYRTELSEAVSEMLAQQIDSEANRYELPSTLEVRLQSQWLIAMRRHSQKHPKAFIAASYQIAGDLAAAYKYQEAIDLVKPLLNTASGQPPELFGVRSDLARWEGEAGHVHEAVAQLHQLVDDAHASIGEEHAQTLAIEFALAYWLKESGDLRGCQVKHREVRERREKILGEDHPDTLLSRLHLARLRAELGDGPSARERHSGDIEAAINDLLTLREVSTDALGPDSCFTHAVRAHLYKVRGYAGDREGAVRGFEKLLTDTIACHDREHPHTLTTRHNLARWLRETGDRDNARKLFKKVLRDREQILGKDHPDTLATKKRLAILLIESGQAERALDDLRDVCRDMEKILGAGHWKTQKAREDLEDLESRAVIA